MTIEYDPHKARENVAKHGVTFEEAATVLLDPYALGFEDENAQGEPRWILLGISDLARLLVVVYTLRDEDRIRLISARQATRKEIKQYEYR